MNIQDPRFRRKPFLQLVPRSPLVSPGLVVSPVSPVLPAPVYVTEAVEEVLARTPSAGQAQGHVAPDFSVNRQRKAIAGQPGRFYSYEAAWQGLRSGQRIRWGKQHRIRVAVGKGGGVLLTNAQGRRHKFKTRKGAAAHLSKVMNRAAATGGFHTDIPMTLRGGGSLGGADLGDLGARDSFGRYKEYSLPDGLVVREYRKDELRIMRVSGQVYVSGLPVPKGSAQHARIMALIAAERSENRQERRQRAAGIAASLVESAAAGAVKGYKAKKGKKAPAVEAEDVDTGPVEEPAPASSGLPSWLLPVGIVAGLGLVVAVAMSGRGGGE